MYFGRLYTSGEYTMELDDVFYLQVQESLQGSEGAVAASGTVRSAEPATPRFTLIKLGQSEIHGPEDHLTLIRDHVLFWENLRSDSSVLQAIRAYK